MEDLLGGDGGGDEGGKIFIGLEEGEVGHGVSPRKNRKLFLLTFYTKYHIMKMKERRRRTRGCYHQHACHVVVAPGVLSFFAQTRIVLNSTISGFISLAKNWIP